MIEMTPATIVATLSNISKEIEKKASEIETLDAQATQMKAAYRVAYAESFLKSEGSMDLRRYQADLETSSQFTASEMADQVLRSAREAMRVLRDRLEIGRSLSAIMRMEWSVKD